jgi:hypothetical protein
MLELRDGRILNPGAVMVVDLDGTVVFVDGSRTKISDEDREDFRKFFAKSADQISEAIQAQASSRGGIVVPRLVQQPK